MFNQVHFKNIRAIPSRFALFNFVFQIDYFAYGVLIELSIFVRYMNRGVCILRIYMQIIVKIK